MRERALDGVERKTKEMEYENRELADKVKDDEAILRDRLNELKSMKG